MHQSKHKGRKLKLTPEIQEKICKIIAQGNYIRTACLAAGISPRTYDYWLEKAEDKDDPNNEIYVAFQDAIRMAEAEAEQKLVGYVVEAGQKPQYWAASMTTLERRWPERWGRVDRLESEHRVSGDLMVILHIPDPKPRPELIEGEATTLIEATGSNNDQTEGK